MTPTTGPRQRFRATVDLNGKTATGIRVPATIVTALGSGKRVAVQVTINGYTYRSTVTPMGGEYLIPVSGEIRTAAGVAAGDEVDVELELDTAVREVTVPADLARALGRDADARRFFEGLSYTNKRGYVTWVEGAKKAETRERRVSDAIAKLRQGRAHY